MTSKFELFTNLNETNLDDLLQALLADGGFNDLYLATGYLCLARRDGRIAPVSTNALSQYDIESLAKKIFGESIITALASGKDDDIKYDIPDLTERGKRYPFRVNIQGIEAIGGGDGAVITLRAIDQIPPSLAALGIEQTIIDNFFPQKGLVIFSGPTGSGKSTTLASLMTYHMEVVQKDKIIQTIESPIEYKYDHLEHCNNAIFQSSVGEFKTNLRSYAQGVRGTLRRGTDGTIVGELRDLETIEAAMVVGNTGQTVWGTLHVNSISQVPSRMIGVFPQSMRSQLKIDFYSNIRMIVCQELYQSARPEKKRIAVKEWLVFTKEMRETLTSCEPQDEKVLLERYVREHGMLMSHYAKKLYEDGWLYENDYKRIVSGE
jgi:Tfp pilus assembly pilus retraction ATPase PilT